MISGMSLRHNITTDIQRALREKEQKAPAALREESDGGVQIVLAGVKQPDGQSPYKAVLFKGQDAKTSSGVLYIPDERGKANSVFVDFHPTICDTTAKMEALLTSALISACSYHTLSDKSLGKLFKAAGLHKEDAENTYRAFIANGAHGLQFASVPLGTAIEAHNAAIDKARQQAAAVTAHSGGVPGPALVASPQ